MVESVMRSEAVTAPFDAVADTYDDTFTRSQIGLAQRAVVHRELERVFRPGQRILELNCGTGVDAVYLAAKGMKVVGCDASARMIEIARDRAAGVAIESHPEFLVLPTESIATLLDSRGHARFDGAFSNFAGLNCVADLSPVASRLATLLKPGATVLICVFGRLCAWEILWYVARGNPRKAFRRLRPEGDKVRLGEGVTVDVHYPSVRTLAHIFLPQFQLKRWKGVGVAVPPTYLESISCRFPKVLRALAGADRWLGSCPLLRSLADHVLIEFERTKA